MDARKRGRERNSVSCRACTACGEAFVAHNRNGVKKKFCSRECKEAYMALALKVGLDVLARAGAVK